MRNLPSYICTMSNGDYDILEEIICKKYHEFLNCYWLLKEYTEFIEDIKYDDSEKEKLIVDVKMEKLNLDEVSQNLKSECKCKKVSVSKRRSVIHLVFHK